MGRVSKSTWISAHNMQRASLLCHWGSANSCRTQKNKTQQIELTATGYRLLGPDKKTDFASPKNMLEVHGECDLEEIKYRLHNCFPISDCLTNYRSVQNRLWPWDWTPEALIRVLEVSFK